MKKTTPYFLYNTLKAVFFLITTFCCSGEMFALKMVGIVVDVASNKPLEDVTVYNVHTNNTIKTKGDGAFQMEVNKGDLIEFRKIAYKIARVNIQSTQLPRFFNIQLAEGPIELDEVTVMERSFDPAVDSMKKREVYRQALEHYKLSGLDAVQHPFDALSKRNRRIWKFQKNYEYWEQDKFIDYVFNDRLIVQLTNLGADSLETYKKLYRPNYALIRSWNEYQYYSYIKETVGQLRRQRSRSIIPVDTTKGYKIYNSEE